MVIEFIHNAALLITLSVFYGVFFQFRKKNPLLYKLLTGSWFGIIAAAGMIVPFVYQPGVFFDGRSIVLTLAGLFGGLLPGIIAAVIAGLYRLYIGGAGVWAGLATIVFCVLAGLAFRKIYRNKPSEIQLPGLILIGISVHILMLACQLLYPWPNGLTIIKNIWLPVITVFPLAFLLMSILLAGHEKRYYGILALRQAESLYRTTLYSIGDAVITTNKKGQIQQMNFVAEQLTGWLENDAKEKKFESVFRIFNEITKAEEESPVERVLKLKTTVTLDEKTILLSKDRREIPISDSGSPIIDEDGSILGVVVVFRDQTEERHRQNLLEKNEAKFRELVESVDAISWEYDIELDKWTYVAPQVTDKLGWNPEEWTNMEFWIQNIHPDDREWALNYCYSCTAKGESHNMEYRFLSKSGTYLWIRDVVTVETNNNKPFKLRGIMIDITARKKMELDLQQKNEFINTILDQLPVGIALNKIDDGTTIYLNRKFEDIYGWELPELKNASLLLEKIIPDETYRNQVNNKINADLSSGDPANMHWEDISSVHRNGSGRMVNTAFIPLIQQNIMITTVVDVTLQRQAEKALKESEEHFRKLFENHTAIHLLIRTNTGDIINANQAAADFYGYSIEQLKQMNIYQINTLTREEISEAIKSTAAKEKFIFEFKHRLADGTLRDVEVFSSVINLNGTKYNYSIIHDITDKKELLREIIRAKERAEESDKLKSAFVANMSHEIRTPLNGILGFTELLTSDREIDPSKKTKYSGIIKKNAESLMQIINDILDISKLETGQISIVKRKFNLNETLINLHSLYSQKLTDGEKNHLHLKLVTPHRKVILNTDENRLSQVFVNLLDNAIKFTHEGSISFGVKEIMDSKIVFEVTDSGIGIAADKQTIIFERFTQAGNEISINYGGNGLGLSIVKKLISLMGGEIRVESHPGKGSKFIFHLPLN